MNFDRQSDNPMFANSFSLITNLCVLCVLPFVPFVFKILKALICPFAYGVAQLVQMLVKKVASVFENDNLGVGDTVCQGAQARDRAEFIPVAVNEEDWLGNA